MMNIVAIDPVPGWSQHKAIDSKLNNLVRSYFGVYAQHEEASLFVPVLPKAQTDSCPDYQVLTFPGHHAAVAGSNGTQRDGLQDPGVVNADLSHISILIRNLSLKLQEKGSQFHLEHGVFFEKLTDKEILERYHCLRGLEETYIQIAGGGYGTSTSDNHGKVGMAIAGLVSRRSCFFTFGISAGIGLGVAAGALYLTKGDIARQNSGDLHLNPSYKRCINCDCDNNYYMHQCSEFALKTDPSNSKRSIIYPRGLFINKHHLSCLKGLF